MYALFLNVRLLVNIFHFTAIPRMITPECQLELTQTGNKFRTSSLCGMKANGKDKRPELKYQRTPASCLRYMTRHVQSVSSRNNTNWNHQNFTYW